MIVNMEITFPHGCLGQALGRNGIINVKGLVVRRYGEHVHLYPVTTKNLIGRCWLSIPVRALPKVVAVIRRERVRAA